MVQSIFDALTNIKNSLGGAQTTTDPSGVSSDMSSDTLSDSSSPDSAPLDSAPPAPPTSSSSSSSSSSSLTVAVPIILYALYMLFIFIIAIFVCNSMILLPWPLRIAGFLFTFVISLVNPLALIAITGYFFLNSLYSIYNNFTTKTGETRNIIPTIFALIPLRIKPDQPENTLWTLLLGLFTYDNPVAIDRLINREIQQGKELFRTKPVPPEVDGLAETLKNTLTRSLLSVPEGRLEAEPEVRAEAEPEVRAEAEPEVRAE